MYRFLHPSADLESAPSCVMDFPLYTSDSRSLLSDFVGRSAYQLLDQVMVLDQFMHQHPALTRFHEILEKWFHEISCILTPPYYMHSSTGACLPLFGSAMYLHPSVTFTQSSKCIISSMIIQRVFIAEIIIGSQW